MASHTTYEGRGDVIVSPTGSFQEPHRLSVKTLSQEEAEMMHNQIHRRESKSMVQFPDLEAIESFLKLSGWSSSDGQIQIPSSVSPPPRFAILDADANFAAWATRSRSEGVPPYPALMNPSPSNDLRHPGLLGYARSRSEFLVAASILIVFGILLIIVGALCMADPSGHIHPFGGFGGFLGIPLVFFGCMFIALTINANSYFPTITHRQGLPSSSFL